MYLVSSINNVTILGKKESDMLALMIRIKKHLTHHKVIPCKNNILLLIFSIDKQQKNIIFTWTNKPDKNNKGIYDYCISCLFLKFSDRVWLNIMYQET